MRTNTINIAEILSRQPIGTKLYSPLCGEVVFDHITEEGNHIICRSRNIPGSGSVGFTSDGRFYDGKGRVASDGECLLFPSKFLRQWDVTQFEDGDVVAVEIDDMRFDESCLYIMIFEKFDWSVGFIQCHAMMRTNSDDWCGDRSCFDFFRNPYEVRVSCRAAYEREVLEIKQALFEHHLQWNAEKKCVEPLPNEEEQTFTHFKFEPFDKVLVRDDDDDLWRCDLFESIDEKDGMYNCIGSFRKQCIPYNDDTKHLLCTSKPYKPQA